MGRPSRFSPEVRERAVRMVFDHESEYDSQWAAIRMVADKIGCSSETLRNWGCSPSVIATAARIRGSGAMIGAWDGETWPG
jgi:transposase